MVRKPSIRKGTVLSKLVAFLALSAGMFSLGAASGLAVYDDNELHPYIRAKIERLQRKLPRHASSVSTSNCDIELSSVIIASVDLEDAQAAYEKAEEDYAACSESEERPAEPLVPVPLVAE